MQKTKKHSLIEIFRSLLPWIFFFGLLLITFKVANAQGTLGAEWDKYLQDVAGFAPNAESGEELAIGFVLNLVRIVRNVIGAVALIMGTIYGLRMVLARGQEEELSKQRRNFLWALFGFVILIISENVATIFNPERATSDALVDFNAARDQLRDIVNYIKWLLGSVIVLLMAVSSIRMVTAGGDEETITSQRRNLIWSGIGMLVILLANSLVNAVYVLNTPDEVVAADASAGITEITGIIRLILVFMGPVAIAFTIYAGFVYLTALENEERANQGKRMIAGGVVGIVIIYAAFAIVNTITSQDLTFVTSFIA